MASETAASPKPEGATHGVDAVVPERVAKCLEESKDFGQYKLARQFKFLHMFSGLVDVLAQALKAECDKEGITCVVESYDKLVDEKHDMTLDQPYETILNKAKNQEYDGGRFAQEVKSMAWRPTTVDNKLKQTEGRSWQLDRR